jgi:hypothetical protein
MNRRYPAAFTLSFALHLVLAAVAISLSTRPVLTRTVRATIGAPASIPPMRAIPQVPAPPESPPDDELFHLDQESATINFSGLEFDLRKIAGRASSLFPFLQPERLTFPRVTPRQDGLTAGFASLFDKTPPEASKAPLVLGDGALQVIVDGAWSRRERWQPFQSVLSLANTYNGQIGRLPELLRRYVDQNALQPYIDAAARDPRLWVELGIAADHRDFIEFVNEYASAHPSTKATTELLFLLDKFAQGSFDALITLLDARPEDLRLTRQVNREAFELLMVMQRYYRSELDLRGLATRYALRTHYDNVRLTILRAIVDTAPAGYRAGDARFLIGCIYWRAGNPGDAIRSWWKLNIDSADTYLVASSQVLAAIHGVAAQDPSTLDPARITGAIDRILDADRSRWISFSSDRLRQFGYAFDKF